MKRNRQRGHISMLVLTTVTTAAVLTMGLAGVATGSMGQAVVERENLTVYQASQTALEMGISDAWQTAVSTRGDFQSKNVNVSTQLAAIAGGATVTYTIRPTNDPTVAYVTARAQKGRFVKSTRTLLRSGNVSIWNNAIFAGTGAAGRSINGNVDIRGSMHLLGDGEAYSDLNGNGRRDPAEAFTDSNRNGVWDPGEPFTDANGDGVWNAAEPYNDTNRNGLYDPPITTTELNSDFSGRAYVGNNYENLSANLRLQAPPPPVVGGLETLGAEVRVKHGKIALSGTAAIGASGTLGGGTLKGTIDGTYVNDGFGGNQGTSNVFSDNGTNNQYDLSTLGIKFPLLSGIGADQYVASDGTTWPSHQNYFDNRALTVPVTTIDDNTASFNYGPDARGNRLRWTAPVKAGNRIVTPGVLEVQGIVRVAGDITLGSSKGLLNYRGRGTLYSAGSMNIRASFLPELGRRFPTDTTIGLVARHDMNLATGNGDAQLQLAGAFYAQGTVRSAKQNEIIGTFVGNFYDMGTNVPAIFQVPSLVRNMPPDMPGDKALITIKTRSWRMRSQAQARG